MYNISSPVLCGEPKVHNVYLIYLHTISYLTHPSHDHHSDLLPRINPVGFLTLPGHSGRASLRGISAPVVHISFCVRAVIATAFCQDANITTAITCVLSLGKNLTYHAARFLVCTRDKYYTAIQQINVSINRQYGIHPTAKDRGLSACYDRNGSHV